MRTVERRLGLTSDGARRGVAVVGSGAGELNLATGPA